MKNKNISKEIIDIAEFAGSASVYPLEARKLFRDLSEICFILIRLCYLMF